MSTRSQQIAEDLKCAVLAHEADITEAEGSERLNRVSFLKLALDDLSDVSRFVELQRRQIEEEMTLSDQQEFWWRV